MVKLYSLYDHQDSFEILPPETLTLIRKKYYAEIKKIVRF